MKCMNCGAELTESAYCPKCGCDVSVQKQAIVLSGIYYNQGLEKAQVRDLSGAIDQLKRSLKFIPSTSHWTFRGVLVETFLDFFQKIFTLYL